MHVWMRLCAMLMRHGVMGVWMKACASMCVCRDWDGWITGGGTLRAPRGSSMVISVRILSYWSWSSICSCRGRLSKLVKFELPCSLQ